MPGRKLFLDYHSVLFVCPSSNPYIERGTEVWQSNSFGKEGVGCWTLALILFNEFWNLLVWVFLTSPKQKPLLAISIYSSCHPNPLLLEFSFSFIVSFYRKLSIPFSLINIPQSYIEHLSNFIPLNKRFLFYELFWLNFPNYLSHLTLTLFYTT